jgi:hypothetical protein
VSVNGLVRYAGTIGAPIDEVEAIHHEMLKTYPNLDRDGSAAVAIVLGWAVRQLMAQRAAPRQLGDPPTKEAVEKADLLARALTAEGALARAKAELGEMEVRLNDAARVAAPRSYDDVMSESRRMLIERYDRVASRFAKLFPEQEDDDRPAGGAPRSAADALTPIEVLEAIVGRVEAIIQAKGTP